MMGPKEKKERSLGERLHLKGERCQSPKCAMVRKPHRPGMHGQKRKPKALSDFGLQLREKRKFKVSYGIDDAALRTLFNRAHTKSGATGARLIELLERRLDNVIFRLGFAPSRINARQLVSHGHIMVNGKRVRAPGYEVRPKDVIGVWAGSRETHHFKNRKEKMGPYEPPNWLHLDRDAWEGRVLSVPADVDIPFEVNVLVESFSK